MTYIERIHNVTTNKITERDYTAAEIAEVKAKQAEAEILLSEQTAKAVEKAALLAKLGITADEAKLLLS